MAVDYAFIPIMKFLIRTGCIFYSAAYDRDLLYVMIGIRDGDFDSFARQMYGEIGITSVSCGISGAYNDSTGSYTTFTLLLI